LSIVTGMPHRFRALLAIPVATMFLAAFLTALASPSVASSPRAAGAPGSISLRAGLNDNKDPNIAVLEFLPSSFKVAKGTKVTWSFAGPEPHSVTFVAPGQPRPNIATNPALTNPTPPTGPYDGNSFVNSGVLPTGEATTVAKFSMTFSTPGTYTYYCVLHPKMDGTVQVTDDTQTSQKQITKNGNAQLAKWESEGEAAKKKLTKTKPKPVVNTDGSTTYTVEMGASTPHTDVLAFSPTPQKLKTGDHVTFVNNSGAPHTASFGGTLVPTDPTAGNVLFPVPGPSPQTLLAGAYLNTGWLQPKASASAVARSFTFDVPNPGKFTYACVLHLPSGMAGEVDAS
jgi:plastocyanin